MLDCQEILTLSQHPLTDNQYMERKMLDLYYFHSDKIYAIKDTTSTYMAITPFFARMLGFKDISQIVGIVSEGTGKGLPSKFEKFTEVCYNQDRLVENTREARSTLNVFDYYTGLAILKSTKEPIINPYTGNVLGTLAYDVPFTIDPLLKVILDIHGKRFGNKHVSMSIVNSLENLKLTKRESEVLFCVSLGLSDRKAIASLLTTVYKKEIREDTTVKDALQNLYEKLPCNNISALAEYIVTSGLHVAIPKSFLSRHGTYELQQCTPIIR